MNDAAKEVIGYKRRTKSEQLSKDTQTTVEERKQLKKNLLDAKSPKLKETAAAQLEERQGSEEISKENCTEQLAKEAQKAAEI